MAFMAPLVTSLTTSLTGVGITSSGLGAVGTGITALGTLQQLSFQQKVAQNQAILSQQQADDARERGQIEQQEQDFDAAMQMGAETARLAASGFDVTAGSLGRRRSYQKLLARRDSLRIRNDSEREAVGFENQAQNARTEAKGFGLQQVFSLFEGATNFGSSLIGEATLVNRRKAARVGRTA